MLDVVTHDALSQTLRNIQTGDLDNIQFMLLGTKNNFYNTKESISKYEVKD